jgi:hypothetical protein
LELKGEVERKDFVALVNNRWPGAAGERLTVRMNETRLEDVIDKKIPLKDPETGKVQKQEVSNRRAGHDFTFSVPKSISLYLAVTEDKALKRSDSIRQRFIDMPCGSCGDHIIDGLDYSIQHPEQRSGVNADKIRPGQTQVSIFVRKR